MNPSPSTRPGRRSGHGWAIGGVIAVGVALLLAWFVHEAPAPKSPVARPLSLASSRPGNLPLLAPVALAASRDEGTAGSTLPPGWLEVCNSEPLSPEAAADVRGERTVARLSRLDTLLRQLQIHPDPRSRAAGMALADGLALVDNVVKLDRAVAACADKACEANVLQAAQDDARRAAERLRGKLVGLALSSDDVGIYALAVQMCTTYGHEVGACRQVSLAEWARREPDNMAPWLLVARQAAERKDVEGRDEALFRAAAAGRQDHHHRIVTRAALAALPDGADAMLQESVLLLAQHVRDSLLPIFNMAAACTPELLRDANRWQRCDTLAEALTQRGNSMLELRFGTRIGEAVGWSRDRIAGLREEAEAMGQAHGLVLGTERSLSCPAIAALRSFLAETGELGELATGRAMVSRLGQPPAALARAFRERLSGLQTMADRPPAAGAPSAPAPSAASEPAR